MTDQEIKDKLENKQEQNVIYDVKTYVDKRGFEVRELDGILQETEKDNWEGVFGKNINREYYGHVVLTIQTGNPQRPYVQQPIQFKFPDTVKDIKEAYNTFESEIEKEIERLKAEAEKQRVSAGKEIIVPGTMKFQPKES